MDILPTATDPPPPAGPVTLANWERAPHLRWSFQRVRELVPCARIERGAGHASALPSELRDMLAVDVPDPAGGSLTLAEVLAQTATDGFLVIDRGTVVCELYMNGMRPSTRHLLQSVSKSFAGSLAGILTEKGALSPDEQVTARLPELAGSSFEGATVRQVLDMTTGTCFSEDYDDPDSDVRRYEQVIGWAPAHEPPAAHTYEYITTLRNHRPHGEMWEYRSILTDLLAWILERAAGERYPELVSRELWQRLAPEHDAEITVDGHGIALADGGMSVTLRDLGRFGLLHARDGRHGDDQVVPEWWVHDTRNGDAESREAFAQGDEEPHMPGGMYRNQWWIPRPGGSVQIALGIHGQQVYVDADRDLVGVKLSTLDDAIDRRAEALAGAAFVAVADAL